MRRRKKGKVYVKEKDRSEDEPDYRKNEPIQEGLTYFREEIMGVGGGNRKFPHRKSPQIG